MSITETNPLSEYEHADVNDRVWVEHDDPELVVVNRLRYVSDPGFAMWDCSYIYGVLADGRNARVRIPAALFQIPKSHPATYLLGAWPELRRLVPGGYVRSVLSLSQ